MCLYILVAELHQVFTWNIHHFHLSLLNAVANWYQTRISVLVVFASSFSVWSTLCHISLVAFFLYDTHSNYNSYKLANISTSMPFNRALPPNRLGHSVLFPVCPSDSIPIFFPFTQVLDFFFLSTFSDQYFRALMMAMNKSGRILIFDRKNLNFSFHTICREKCYQFFIAYAHICVIIHSLDAIAFCQILHNKFYWNIVLIDYRTWILYRACCMRFIFSFLFWVKLTLSTTAFKKQHMKLIEFFLCMHEFSLKTQKRQTTWIKLMLT